MALNAYARAATDRVLTPVGRAMARMGLTANGLTTAGLVLSAAGAAVVLAGYPRAGAWVLAVGAATDAFDGIVARERGTAGPFGAFYDSVADRVGDVLIFGTVAWLVRDDPLLFGVAVFVLGGSQLTSYIRAKAESLGWNATVGVLERAERVIIILLAIHFAFVPLALWVLAAGTLVTVVQRVRAVLRQARTAADPSREAGR
ncbi:MAG TPA: CDP-alcohol phosphatidyltransferase family protein [Egibacteraceae bacterium]|jgi:CDP-diacylglycerol---glycerol-3-phosphate 3-phosphatidyltransferase|nr:CDP-alcohol phosphatidyltransferase family protein [Egibacteraceae bacterium]